MCTYGPKIKMFIRLAHVRVLGTFIMCVDNQKNFSSDTDTGPRFAHKSNIYRQYVESGVLIYYKKLFKRIYHFTFSTVIVCHRHDVGQVEH